MVSNAFSIERPSPPEYLIRKSHSSTWTLSLLIIGSLIVNSRPLRKSYWFEKLFEQFQKTV